MTNNTFPVTENIIKGQFEPEDFPQFLDSDDIDKTKERYVFFPGDLITPRRKQETREMQAIGIAIDGRPFRVTVNGGEDYQHRCLVRTKGIVPRAFITPLEIGANWVPPELVPAGADTFAPMQNDDFTVRGGVAVGTKSKYLVGEKYFPGHAIAWMLSFARNNGGFSRGLVEINQLFGQSFKDGAPMELQRLYFPNYPILPVRLSELQSDIQDVMKAQQGTVREIGQLFLHACDEFRIWGTNFVAVEHGQIKIGTHASGHVYEYSDTAQLLMEQLEITRQDQQFQTVARMQEEQARASTLMMQALTEKDSTDEDMKRMFMASIENQNKIMQMLATALTPAAAKEETRLEPPKPSAPKLSKS